jgi:hypothetical protein
MSQVLVLRGHDHCVFGSRQNQFFLCAIAAGTKDDHVGTATKDESEEQGRQLDEQWNCSWIEIVEHVKLLFELKYGWSRGSQLEPITGTQTGAAG